MDTPARIKRTGWRRIAMYVTAGLAALSLLLAACSSGSAQIQDSPSHTEAPRASASPSGSGPATQASPLPDPHALTGLSEVPNIADPQPIEGTFPQSLPATVTDFEGNSVTIHDTSRILALDINGTLSRTIISLGFGAQIVGRTVSSTEAQLADLPVVTENGHSLNTEAILSLAPTVIVADRSVGPPEALDQLRASGIPVVLVDPGRSIESTGTLIRTVAAVLGVPSAGDALAERTDKETQEALAQIAQWVPEQPLDIAFLYVRGTAGIFFILGADEGADDLISAVGGRDVAAANGIASTTPANAESLVALNPEVIFTMHDGLESTDGMEGLLARPGVAQTRAGANQRVISIPDGISLAFGPQTGEVLLAIAKALYGVAD